MITGFEQYTAELSDYERDTLLPAVMRGMESKRGRENAISNKSAITKMKSVGYEITEPRFRKIMHVIRVSGMMPGIVADSNGYYIAVTNDEWEKYLDSIAERSKHIMSLRDALNDQYIKWKNND